MSRQAGPDAMPKLSGWRIVWISAALAAPCLILARPAWSSLPSSPEQETLAISRHLKPISDDDWKLVAGQKLSESYSVVKGDTLYDVSNRLFGDPKYWPKIWALNNALIGNPHIIEPGNLIAFMPGTGTSLPAFKLGGLTGGAGNASGDEAATAVASADGVEGAATATDGEGAPRAKGPRLRSTDWKVLPKQRWEEIHVDLPPQVDPDGFDRRSKVLRTANVGGVDLPRVVYSERVEQIGEIRGGRSPGIILTLNDQIYIEGEENIQIGENYALVDRDPTRIVSEDTGRIGYTYTIRGQVKILAERDNLYIGNITKANHPIERGDMLIPLPPKIAELTPIAGPKPVRGTMLLDHVSSAFLTAQFKQVYIDRGTDDGIQPGMIFRAYLHYDPSSDRRLSREDFIIQADMMVVQVSEHFCTALMGNAGGTLEEETPVVLLTDVSDVDKSIGFQQKTGYEKAMESELDELDRLGKGSGLNADEKRELNQLERWKRNPPKHDAPPTEELPPLEGEPTSPEKEPVLPPGEATPANPDPSSSLTEPQNPVAPPQEPLTAPPPADQAAPQYPTPPDAPLEPLPPGDPGAGAAPSSGPLPSDIAPPPPNESQSAPPLEKPSAPAPADKDAEALDKLLEK